MSRLPPCVLVDRDGVLNEDRPDHVRSPDEWVWLDGVPEALARLRAAGIRVAVVTNQSGLGQGILSPEDLERIHGRMTAEAGDAGGRIDGVFFCPHVDADACGCRKPLPGLLHQAAEDLGCELTDVPFVGDAERDLQAALAAGAEPVLVRTGKGAATESRGLPPGTVVHADLPAFVDSLLEAASA
ncbi:D-glycero-beta-D-manno-heptose 1,7-bisphosphate 7-phosphatase [Thiohalorhabdus sp.]|uniref:D-glycero-beta-D-manno-heptose 1,7-bisphosphate 7-phosphatase n=1 Tax=Thiohalorhabdus sp. TaxID=3094134 RepID=UPI002FC2EEAD